MILILTIQIIVKRSNSNSNSRNNKRSSSSPWPWRAVDGRTRRLGSRAASARVARVPDVGLEHSAVADVPMTCSLGVVPWAARTGVRRWLESRDVGSRGVCRLSLAAPLLEGGACMMCPRSPGSASHFAMRSGGACQWPTCDRLRCVCASKRDVRCGRERARARTQAEVHSVTVTGRMSTTASVPDYHTIRTRACAYLCT